MLKPNDRCTGFAYIERTLSYLALEGWYYIDCANVFNILSATAKQESTCRAHLFGLQTIEDEPSIRPVSQQVSYLRETLVCIVCRSIKLTSLRVASEDFTIPNFRQQFRAQIEKDWGHEVCGLVLGYDQIVLLDNIFINLHNVLLYFPSTISQPYFCSVSRT
jgi:hypothetical protein